VVGQHHDPVRPRRPGNDTLDASDLPIEIAKHGERVGSIGARLAMNPRTYNENFGRSGAPYLAAKAGVLDHVRFLPYLSQADLIATYGKAVGVPGLKE
jgi:hypothetical protein